MTPGSSLDQLVAVRGRFARSVRLDKDAGQAEQLEGYLPTGRSLEVVRRLVQAMTREEGTRAFSITGPYGSGKSSLALFVDALLGRHTEEAHQAANALLAEYDTATAEGLEAARRNLGAGPSGFIRAVVTAPQREPITTTVLRALERGARRARVAKDVQEAIGEALVRAESNRFASPSYREIRRLIELLASSGSKKPVLLVIDEFGKNLEAYAESGREGDLYLLQELAEWATGSESLPLVLVTIQHLAFEAYAADASAAQRREWAKVQGRFEDIPFVDSAAATRTLIATALNHAEEPVYAWLRQEAAHTEAGVAERYGLPAVADPDTVAACYPLHPSVLLVLPELCARYGQNERTLFSFLASDEPHSVVTFARAAKTDDGLPWVRLDRVYDYFVESASTFVGASREASRWIEVETTIRDAHGLSDAQQRVFKTVGVLNLVAAGGALRASPELVAYAAADGQPGTSDAEEVDSRLEELNDSGLVVYRDFASEYRVWRGSDFDIGEALRTARRQVRQRSIASLLDEIQPMRPLVAARHTIMSGTTRAFARVYADRRTTLPDFDARDDRGDKLSYEKLAGCDGLLAYVLDEAGELPDLRVPDSDFPIVTVVPSNPQPLIDAAVEVAALLEVSNDSSLPAEDRTARRELIERTAYARQVLDRVAAETFAEAARWTWHNPLNKDGTRNKKQSERVLRGGLGSSALSDVFDRVFAASPNVPNETINRSELSSQGAKARRILLEAAVAPSRRHAPRLGLEGEGADVAAYRAIVEESGIHDPDSGIGPPTTASWKPVWEELAQALREGSDAPVSVTHLLQTIETPPFGVKRGTASVLLTMALIAHASDIAIYEHGTFRPRFDAPLSERMVRNPENFAVKHLATGHGSKRHQALEALANELAEALPPTPAVGTATDNPTVLTVTVALVDVIHRRADDFTRKTKQFHALWESAASREVDAARDIRDALLDTHEPDVLIFERLPAAVGYKALPASGLGRDAMAPDEIQGFARAVASAVRTVDRAYERLVAHVADTIRNAADCNTLVEVVSHAGDLVDLDVLAPSVRRFADVARMYEAYTDWEAWLGAVTEAVCGGSLRHWNDHTARGHLETLWDVVADYARVASLNRFAAGRTDRGFKAFEVRATGQSGRSQQDIVVIPERSMSHVLATLDAAVDSLATDLGGQDEAAEALLAALAERFISGHPGTAVDTVPEPRLREDAAHS